MLNKKALFATSAGILSGGFFVLHSSHFWQWWMDDSYISFRYGRNLLDGHGLVFNPGEHIEGITNIGWALLLAPFSHGDALFASKVIGLIFGLLTVFLLTYHLYLQKVRTSSLLLALATISFLPWATFWSVQGMETPAVMFFVTLGWVSFINRKHLPTGVGLGLAPFLRPDSAILAPIFGLWIISKPKSIRQWLLPTIIILFCGVTLITLKLAFYGQIIPNTFEVKVGGWPFKQGWQYMASFFQIPWPIFSISALIATLFSLSHAIKRNDQAIPGIIVLVYCAISIFTSGDFFANYRFLVPAIPALAACFAQLSDYLLSKTGTSMNLIIALGGAFILLPQTTVDTVDLLRQEDNFPRTSAKLVKKKAPFLKPWNHLDWNRGYAVFWTWPSAWTLVNTQPTDNIAFTDIGMLSYVARNPITDLLGLSDPKMVSFHERQWPDQKEYLTSKVDYLIINMSSGRWNRYRDWLIEDHWDVVDGCGNIRVFENPIKKPKHSKPTEEQQKTAIKELFERAPRQHGLQVAVVRELTAYGANKALIESTLKNIEQIAPPKLEFPLGELWCTTGLSPNCTPNLKLCDSMLAQERDLTLMGEKKHVPPNPPKLR